jgi:hypothetical protein
MKSSCHFFFNHLGMPTQFSNSNFPVSVILDSVLRGTNLYSTNLIPATHRVPSTTIAIQSDTDHAENTALKQFRGADHTENFHRIVAWRGPYRKHFHRIVAWCVCWSVFTEPLPSTASRKFVTIIIIQFVQFVFIYMPT